MQRILITHYQRLLNYIVPDFVHVMSGVGLSQWWQGISARTGVQGYDGVVEEAAAEVGAR
jgi:Fe-S cluster assembly ATP-binding protein